MGNTITTTTMTKPLTNTEILDGLMLDLENRLDQLIDTFYAIANCREKGVGELKRYRIKESPNRFGMERLEDMQLYVAKAQILLWEMRKENCDEVEVA